MTNCLLTYSCLTDKKGKTSPVVGASIEADLNLQVSVQSGPILKSS